uniref:Uncharacterized protein n=1 Tax=Avena sativa TaxID=4498 RepID=A0ACD6APW2_AVESA
MANELGAAGHPIQRWLEATTICFSEEAAPVGRFEVLVACFTKRSFEYWRRGETKPEDKQVQNHAAGGTTMAFSIGNIAALRSADSCRGTLRGMLVLVPELRALRLTEDERDAVVPGDIVPVLVDAARRGDGFTFSFTMEVQLRVIHDERALVLACKEWLAATASGEKDCPICLDGLEQESTAGAGTTSGSLLCSVQFIERADL